MSGIIGVMETLKLLASVAESPTNQDVEGTKIDAGTSEKLQGARADAAIPEYIARPLGYFGETL
jgi:hypothetical protein